LNNFHPGVDIVDVDRIKSSIEKYQDKFLSKVFNKEEQDYCNSKSNPFIHFSGKFAAKEAISKANGTGIGKDLSFKDIKILKGKKGEPVAKISKLELKKKIHISISHSDEFAVAFAIMENK